MVRYDENYRPSYMWVGEKKSIYFDTLIVQNNDCEAVYTAFGDSAHVTQAAVRFIRKDGTRSAWGKTGYALHVGEVEPLVRNSASEVTAFRGGVMVYHIADGKVDVDMKPNEMPF